MSFIFNRKIIDGHTVYDLGNTLFRYIDGQISTLRRFVYVVNTSEASDLPSPRFRVDASAVRLFAVFEWCGNMD